MKNYLKANNEEKNVENINDKINDKIFYKFDNIINRNNINIFNSEKNTKKNLVKKIISEYYTNIELLEKRFSPNNNEEYFNENYIGNQYYYQNINRIYLSKEKIEEFSKELKLTEKSKNFIKCYYLNDKNQMLKEIIKIMPEIYNYKSKHFNKNINGCIKKFKENLSKNKEEIYNNIVKIMENFIENADISYNVIKQIFYPLFYTNGFFDLARIFRNKLSISDEILINLTLDNIKRNFEKVYINELMKPDNNILFYYLNYKLNYCLNIFLANDEIIFEKEYIFKKYKKQFGRLFQLMENIKNKKYLNENKINIEDIDKLIEYIKYNNEYNYNDESTILELLDLFDITNYISLYLFKLVISNISIKDNFNQLKEDNIIDYYNTIFVLYKLSMLFNEVKSNDIPEYKKLLIFSFFNIFKVKIIPNVEIFKHYQSINVCLLNNKSILLTEIFKGIYSEGKDVMHIFDTNGDNLLINNNKLYKIFSLLLSRYINIIYDKNISILNSNIPKDPFEYNIKNSDNESYFYNIIYYYHMLNYDNSKNKPLTLDEFWNYNIKNKNDLFKSDNVIIKFNDNKFQYQFYLYRYLIAIFFNNKISPQVLLSYIKEYNDRINGDISNTSISNELFVLFNFIKINFPNISSNNGNNNINFMNLKIESNSFDIDYDDLKKALFIIKTKPISLLNSILFLRALLPFILNIISDIEKIDLYLFYFEKEKIFNNYKNIIKFNLKNDEKELLIREYFRCLNAIITEYSLDLDKYSKGIKKENDYENVITYMNINIYEPIIEKFNNEKEVRKKEREKGKGEENVEEKDKNKEKEKENIAKKEKEIISKLLTNAYYKNKTQLKINYNWSFHFIEIIFYCFYLNFVHCQNYLYSYSSRISDIYDIISKYLDNYEKKDYYFNFINEEGAKLNIARIIKNGLYNNIKKNNDNNNSNNIINIDINNIKKINQDYFKQKISIRRKLLKEHKYNLISKNELKKINIFKKPNNYNEEETKNEYHVIIDNSNNLSLFKNNYNVISESLKRFLFDGYNEYKSSTIDEIYSDLTKINNDN